jgi:hypothetical protein
MSGELAVELLAELLDIRGGVFEAAEPFRMFYAAQLNMRLIAAAVATHSLNAGLVTKSGPVVLVGGVRAFSKVDCPIVCFNAVCVVALWLWPTPVVQRKGNSMRLKISAP